MTPAFRSALVRRTSPARQPPALGTVVALHDRGGQSSDLVALCHVVAPRLAVCAPQGPFSRNPLLSSGSSGSRAWGDYSGYSWFRHDVDGRPDPASFGDALATLEELVDETRARTAGGRLYLLGRGEGATLTRAALHFFPARLDGVVALGGETVPAWAAQLAPDVGRRPPTLERSDDTDVAALARWFDHLSGGEETHGHA